MKKICIKLVTIILIFIFLASTNISFAVTQEEINAQKQEQSQKEEQIKEIEQKK